ncbi:MAG: ParB/RepB/Spo0J family partition protein [Planktomarina sp.]|nr:ParB/RepB/Spo0J family partition protein [Planktomarina sp.]
MSNVGKQKRGLGRGLSALMADIEPNPKEVLKTATSTKFETLVPIEKINPNPNQPRRYFAENDLNDLADSIRSKGIIQPLVVRPHPNKNGEFEIVAGERRWRASQIAQIHQIPVVVREFSNEDVLEIAIIENIQRADLNPIEEAAGYRQLMEKFGHTQDQVAQALGKSRPHIANHLRLLVLPNDVQDLVIKGKISSGHARALITSKDPSEIAKLILSRGLSVRQTESLVKKRVGEKPVRLGQKSKDADTRLLEGDLSAALKMAVSILHRPNQEFGEINIRYKNLEQLDDLCRHLTKF